jgi:Uma2 family endonuclease
MPVAQATKIWTLEELDSLPDDGNTYELIGGELFVRPPPSDYHETIGARLHALLLPYVMEQKLGLIYRPRSVVRYAGSQVEPDLMIRQPMSDRKAKWEDAPVPSLVVEILSPYTRQRDHEQKRHFYVEKRRVPEYWIIDPENSTLRRIRPNREDEVSAETLVWHPAGASRALTIALSDVFGGDAS